MCDDQEVVFSLKVMVNKEKGKVLFAEADAHFVDILLSFLTLPLGRILKVLEKHYGDEAPAVGSLTNLYHSLANLDTDHFVTEDAKLALLNPRSSFEAEHERLKLDIADSPPAEYFYCSNYSVHYRFRSVSTYYDNISYCTKCYKYTMSKEVAEKGTQAASGDGVFTMHRASFIVSDDLQIFPNARGLLQIISILGISDMMDKAEPIKVTMGFNEIMSLLKGSLVSATPLSDLILNKPGKTSSVIVESEPKALSHHIENQENPESKKIVLKVMVQKSTGKFLYAQAEEDFVEFLFTLFNIPLGGAEHLVAGSTSIKAIDNLYRSTSDLIDDKYFKSTETKSRLINPKLPHGCMSEDHVLPLTEERLPNDYNNISWFSSVKFPKGRGSYIKGPGTYQVTDDLTVTPFCIVSILTDLGKQKIPISDVEEVELEIGFKEACSILKASLTSTSALTDALLNHIPIKQPKLEFKRVHNV